MRSGRYSLLRHTRTLCILTFLFGSPNIIGGQQSATATLTLTVLSPDVVKAGEFVSFEIKLDKAPTFTGGCVRFIIYGPSTNLGATCEDVPAGERVAKVSYHIPVTGKAGLWYIRVTEFWTGTEAIPLKAEPIPFQVIGNEGLVYPTSAEIKINPSQIQLFRKEAINLQGHIQSLKSELANYNNKDEGAKDVLQRNILQALQSLDSTEKTFLGLESRQSQQSTATVFFDDIRLSYRDALSELKKRKNARHISGEPQWIAVSQSTASPQDRRYPVSAADALRAFEQNELAYEKAADTQSLVFDLTVNSNPSGASISYRRRGDPVHKNPDQTNTVIKSQIG